MKSFQLFFASVFLVISVRILPAQNLTDPIPQDSNVRTGTLANGLKYYIRKNHKPENRAEFRLAVKTGSIMEDDDQQGLAHFCEHMQFNGTEHFPKMDLVNFLESTGVKFGAHLNAYTSFDETVYMLQLPMDKPDVLDKGLLVLEDWAGHATFDSVEIDKERGVVIEEWRLGRGANERVQNKHYPKEFFGSRYADRLPIGKKEILEKCSYETLRRFYRDWYRPDLMAFIAVGDFDLDMMENQIKARFEKLTNPPNEKPRTKYTIPLHENTIVSVAGDKELQFQSAQTIFEHTKEKTETLGDYRRNLIGRIYDGSLTDRIQELMQKGTAPFTFGGVNDGSYLGGINAYTSFVVLKPKNILDGVKAILDEMYRAKQSGFLQTEFDRQKEKLLTQLERRYNERDKTESSRFVSEYLRNFLQNEPYPGIEYEYEMVHKLLPNIMLSEINALSPKRFETKSRVVTISYQVKDTVKPPTEAEVQGILEREATVKLAPYDDKTSNQPLLAAKPKPGKITSEKNISSLGISEWTLSNGARVVLKPTDFKNDEILLSANCSGGSSIASDADHFSAEVADNIVEQSGVADFDATTLKKMLAGKNVTMAPDIYGLTEGFTGNSTPKDAETMFQLLYLYGTAPRKDSGAFKAFRGQMTSFLKNRDADPQTAFRDTIQTTMSQHHPRQTPFTMYSLNRVNLDKAIAFYKDRFSDFGNFTFYIVGNIDMKQMRTFAETYLASLPSTNRKESWRDLGVTPPKGTITKSVYKGIEPKSSVTINLTGPFQWNMKNRMEMQAMSEVLAIKLRETLREDMGGVYGVSVRANPEHYPHERYTMTISFGCDPARVQELINATMLKLDTMVMKAPEDIYMTKVKQIELHDDEVNLKENRYWLGALSQLYWNGEDPNEILQRKDMISALSAEDIHHAAQKYCARDNMVEVVLYPEKKN
ncbi:MAG: M16 family metallopeptidase [Candidatus Kapaibacterium sp.]